MEKKHKKILNLENHMRNLVGQPFYGKKPSTKKILEEILNGLSEHNGICWNPISTEGGTDFIFKQCPGGCGYVWKINIKDDNVSRWLVNEINQRRFGKY